MKLEIENNEEYITRIKSENDDLNRELEDLNEKYNKENGDLNCQNLKLNQNIKITCTEINKLKDEIAKQKK